MFDFANLAYWILLGIGVFLFLLVIVSGGGDEELDLDLDGDADLDLDSDGDFGSLQFLGWLGFGKTPLILLLAIDFSIWGLAGWILNVIVGSITGSIPVNFWGKGGIILIISFSFSLFLGSLIARPLGKIFASFGEDASSDRLLGCVGVVTSKQIPYSGERKVGQADVRDAARNLVSVPVFLPTWAKVIPGYGEQILIIERTNKGYLVIAKNSSDEDDWINNSYSS